MKYRLYLETDLNRVFTKSVGSLAAAELDAVLTHQLGAPDTTVSIVEEGRTSYLCFDHEGDRDVLIAQVAMLSAAAALFAEQGADSLEPLPLRESLRYGTELVTAQRYKGKTSERLTRLMLNLAVASSEASPGQDWSLIDPMCGRGTTLNWTLLYGGRSTGIDVDRKALDDYATFLEQWAKSNRLPHKLQRFKKQNSEHRHFEFTVAANRPDLAEKVGPDITTFNAPADSSSIPVGRHSMIVSDLPYGIQHRARSDRERTPTTVGELVENVSANWVRWMQPGGSVSLSWNVKSLGRSDMRQILADSGFRAIPTQGFEHTVDRMITRDIVLAEYPG